ncbi:hypothetical protein BDW42DRAFT_24170 [Aspergillus taichungensis]|uniref:Uncharacterized protein n=1 Tax=Aspergillus taichungensis TaxID=482145 RepID=A0A2J5I4X1_9EURO|nr:hypothetical protein BDW42DRAFT_24170 [Aspergillus taichungensis]
MPLMSTMPRSRHLGFSWQAKKATFRCSVRSPPKTTNPFFSLLGLGALSWVSAATFSGLCVSWPSYYKSSLVSLPPLLSRLLSSPSQTLPFRLNHDHPPPFSASFLRLAVDLSTVYLLPSPPSPLPLPPLPPPGRVWPLTLEAMQ